MVKLVNNYQFLDSEEDFIKSFFSKKPTDCILYSKEGFQFKIHKEILSQTKLMHNILSSANGCCCQVLEIFCPCSKFELEYMVEFLYQGQIDCSVESNLVKILENLKDIFGFPETLLQECFKDFGEATKKKRFPRKTKNGLNSAAKSNLSSKGSILIQDPNGTQLKANKLILIDADKTQSDFRNHNIKSVDGLHVEKKPFKRSQQNTSCIDMNSMKKHKASNHIDKDTEDITVADEKDSFIICNSNLETSRVGFKPDTDNDQV